jgi:hypothetical protein
MAGAGVPKLLVGDPGGYGSLDERIGRGYDPLRGLVVVAVWCSLVAVVVVVEESWQQLAVVVVAQCGRCRLEAVVVVAATLQIRCQVRPDRPPLNSKQNVN